VISGKNILGRRISSILGLEEGVQTYLLILVPKDLKRKRKVRSESSNSENHPPFAQSSDKGKKPMASAAVEKAPPSHLYRLRRLIVK